MYKIFISLMAIALVFSSCKKDKIDPVPLPQNKLQLGQTTFSGSQKLTLWADDSLRTGYQKLYLVLTNADGTSVSDASLALHPVMDMGSMKHSSPVVQPVLNPLSNMYEGAVVFTMASGMHEWTVNVTVGEESHPIPVKVRNSDLKTTGSYTGQDGTFYQVSLMPGKPFFTGLNDFEILINSKESVMSFPAADNLEIEFSPEMTSMGHSSPNNVAPAFVGNGVYKGKVNFTMTGDWRFHFRLVNNGKVVVEDATADILF